MQILSLNIIGAGRLGQTLGKLFHVSQSFKINGICNSSLISAQKAVDFIGAGLACSTADQLPRADIIMIATPDSTIEETVFSLIHLPNIKQCHTVFHCSGATPSSILSPLKSQTTSIASVHPNMTFASPEVSVSHFAGTYCAFEGDNAAFELLESVFSKIGGNVFHIDADKKAIYHAATCMSCNYIVALLDVAVQLYLKIGVPRKMALSIMQPIVKKTINNVFNLGTVEALTGPIARGDAQTVQNHINALDDQYMEDIYKLLGQQLIKLAIEKGNADKKQLDEIKNILSS